MNQRNDKKWQSAPFQHAFRSSVTALRMASVVAALCMQISMPLSAQAQSQLNPPKPLGSSAATPTAPSSSLAPPAAASTSLAKPAGTAGSATGEVATTGTKILLPNLRMQNIKIGNKLIDLRNLSDSHVLTGAKGKTITIARMKQLQARIDGGSTAPMMLAKPGQSIRTLASAPTGTLIALPGGKVTRSQDMAKIQTIVAKLNVKRVIKPIPVALTNVRAQTVVGQGLTLADALKRPGNEVIQIGSHKYTAEQLRTIDAQLKASKRDPRGLAARATVRTGARGAPSATSSPAINPAINPRDPNTKGTK